MCGLGDKVDYEEGDEEDAEDGHLTESISLIMKCILGSPWRASDDDAALYEEFCYRMKEVRPCSDYRGPIQLEKNHHENHHESII